MFTFLPKAYRSEVLREHRLRVALVFLGMVTASLALGAVLSLPTFFAASAQKSLMLAEKDGLVKKADSAQVDEVASQIKGIQGTVAVLSAQAGRKPLVAVLEEVMSRLGSDVTLSGIAFHRDAGVGIIVIQGMAKTREGLVAFSNNLRGEPAFAKVDLPVSSLAKSKDITFSIRVESSF